MSASGPSDGADDVAGVPRILPRYLTAEERLIPERPVSRAEILRAVPPSGDVYYTAEYGPSQGAFVRWGYFEALLTEFVVGLAQPGSDATAYVLVSGSAEEASASAALVAAGADMDYVEFIHYVSDTGWIRDYGPQFVFEEGGTRAINDAIYSSRRPRDDAFPTALSGMWLEPAYDFPIHHAGGNFMPLSTGEAYVSDIVLTDNPSLSEVEIRALFQDHLGVELTIYPRLPGNIDATGHIDMWLIFLSDTDVLISEFTHSNPSYPGITVTEGAVADLTSLGFTVHRAPAYNSGSGGYGGVHFTYTNAAIVNNKVFIPEYGGTHNTDDAIALAAYQNALPGHSIIPVDCAEAIPYAGAIHCLVMHVPAYTDPIPSIKLVSPDGGEFWGQGENREIRWTAIDDQAVTAVDLHGSTDGGATFPHVIALGEPHDGVFEWTLSEPASIHWRIRATAYDADLNPAEDTSAADFTITDQPPQLIENVDMDTNPGWTTGGLWAWGQPTGQGGQAGGPDPTSGHTGDYVYGYNLSGDYEDNLPQRHLTSAAIDTTGRYGVRLAFWRWLGVMGSDYAYVKASNNGSTWTTVWTNDGALADTEWVYQEIDLASVADDQPTVYLRWTMGTTNSFLHSCGWNIDDVAVWGLIPPAVTGDVDGDGDVDLDDHLLLTACIAGPYVSTVPGGCSPAQFSAADVDIDGDVDLADFGTFQDLLAD
ncbi:MAG: agmatine deiminase family protein [bacterium]|nr:agmatine deiminase family protein [bacterium]